MIKNNELKCTPYYGDKMLFRVFQGTNLIWEYKPVDSKGFLQYDKGNIYVSFRNMNTNVDIIDYGAVYSNIYVMNNFRNYFINYKFPEFINKEEDITVENHDNIGYFYTAGLYDVKYKPLIEQSKIYKTDILDKNALFNYVYAMNNFKNYFINYKFPEFINPEEDITVENHDNIGYFYTAGVYDVKYGPEFLFKTYTLDKIDENAQFNSIYTFNDFTKWFDPYKINNYINPYEDITIYYNEKIKSDFVSKFKIDTKQKFDKTNFNKVF